MAPAGNAALPLGQPAGMGKAALRLEHSKQCLAEHSCRVYRTTCREKPWPVRPSPGRARNCLRHRKEPAGFHIGLSRPIRPPHVAFLALGLPQTQPAGRPAGDSLAAGLAPTGGGNPPGVGRTAQSGHTKCPGCGPLETLAGKGHWRGLLHPPGLSLHAGRNAPAQQRCDSLGPVLCGRGALQERGSGSTTYDYKSKCFISLDRARYSADCAKFRCQSFFSTQKA